MLKVELKNEFQMLSGTGAAVTLKIKWSLSSEMRPL